MGKTDSVLDVIGERFDTAPVPTLYVGPTGVLFVEKSQGWATVDITATCQLKERS
jgi:hypothetical protein